MKKKKHDGITKCKCNAGGRGVRTFLPCSTTANPSLTDDGLKMMFNKKPAWLRADLKGNRFKIPHSTCTKPLCDILYIEIYNIIKEAKIMQENEIEVKMQKLPEDLRREVLDYVDFLLSKYQDREVTKGKFKFDCEGGLSEIREEFTSVQLQHKALDKRNFRRL